ncbi:uncharacterized protein LOC132062160 [Lycium ferocissimum]|uniref:uncharacterized protein LOC132062160 n=1 Tax=Lycium ferocissimum TaxID=112874 RepID=UPI002814BBD9|nr:uncharacterized protein LOC132062160 [Lycium ferocissimum]
MGELRKTLWQSLRDIAQGISTPWMIAGDFNALLYAQDRLLGNPVQYAEIKDFSGCITDLLLNELHWRGNYYTWSNKQQGGDRICSRLDRAFGNLEWMMKWGHVMVEYELPNISDHSPMVMVIQATQNTIKIPFRFFNVWAEHNQFLAIVEATWCKKTNANKMRNIWAKLKDLKPKLKQLNNAEYRNITQRLDKARFDLINIQGQIQLCYTDSLQNQEKALLQELEKWSLIEESIMRQKSRARWIKLGDANTKNLMGTSALSLPAINMQVMKRGPILNQTQRLRLITEITDKEILDSLNAIGDDKAPGVDGYNAVFF